MMFASLAGLLTIAAAVPSFGTPSGDQFVASVQSLLVPPTQVNVAKPISHHSGAVNFNDPASSCQPRKKRRTLPGIRPDQQSTIGSFLATVIIPIVSEIACCQTATLLSFGCHSRGNYDLNVSHFRHCRWQQQSGCIRSRGQAAKLAPLLCHGPDAVPRCGRMAQ